jgi:hypothetical protein
MNDVVKIEYKKALFIVLFLMTARVLEFHKGQRQTLPFALCNSSLETANMSQEET